MNSSHHDRRTAELHQMQRAIAGLLIYQDILDSEVGIALIELLQAIVNGDRSQGNALICLTAYGRFFKALATAKCSWEEYLIDRILRCMLLRDRRLGCTSPRCGCRVHRRGVAEQLCICSCQNARRLE